MRCRVVCFEKGDSVVTFEPVDNEFFVTFGLRRRMDSTETERLMVSLRRAGYVDPTDRANTPKKALFASRRGHKKGG